MSTVRAWFRYISNGQVFDALLSLRSQFAQLRVLRGGQPAPRRRPHRPLRPARGAQHHRAQAAALVLGSVGRGPVKWRSGAPRPAPRRPEVQREHPGGSPGRRPSLLHQAHGLFGLHGVTRAGSHPASTASTRSTQHEHVATVLRETTVLLYRWCFFFLIAAPNRAFILRYLKKK